MTINLVLSTKKTKQKTGTGTPILISALGPRAQASVNYVAVGEEHSLFATFDGKVYACGSVANGKLGIPASSNQFIPVMVRGLEDHPMGQVACGDEFSVALTKSGAAAYWWGLVVVVFFFFCPLKKTD